MLALLCFMTFNLHKEFFYINFFLRQNLTRIWIRMDPHWFGLLDPDPHLEKSWICFLTWIRIETDGDTRECRQQLGFHISRDSFATFSAV
jgi:hypothetical protein